MASFKVFTKGENQEKLVKTAAAAASDTCEKLGFRSEATVSPPRRGEQEGETCWVVVLASRRWWACFLAASTALGFWSEGAEIVRWDQVGTGKRSRET